MKLEGGISILMRVTKQILKKSFHVSNSLFILYASIHILLDGIEMIDIVDVDDIYI
jgi:hypothetical protein